MIGLDCSGDQIYDAKDWLRPYCGFGNVKLQRHAKGGPRARNRVFPLAQKIPPMKKEILFVRARVCVYLFVSKASNDSLKQVDSTKDNNLKGGGLGGAFFFSPLRSP